MYFIIMLLLFLPNYEKLFQKKKKKKNDQKLSEFLIYTEAIKSCMDINLMLF